MGQVVRLAIAGLIVQLFGFASFISIVRLDLAGKEITVGLVLIATFILMIVAVSRLDLIKIILLAAFLAVSFTCIHQLLGFTLFPGLVKDIELFSPDHLIKLQDGMALLFAAYMVGMLGIWITSKLLKIFLPDRVVSIFSSSLTLREIMSRFIRVTPVFL